LSEYFEINEQCSVTDDAYTGVQYILLVFLTLCHLHGSRVDLDSFFIYLVFISSLLRTQCRPTRLFRWCFAIRGR